MFTASIVRTDTTLYIYHLGLMFTASIVCTDITLYINISDGKHFSADQNFKTTPAVDFFN